MKDRLLKFLPRIDTERILAESARLLALERPQTFEAYRASARAAEALLREAGIPGVERLTFPADGKTVWQDKISPLGWTAAKGKITVLAAPGIPPGTVIADYEKNPFELIKGSCATAPEGEVVRVLSYEQVLAGFDPRDALVLTPLDQDCRCRALPYLLDLGARGVISDFSFNAADAPEGVLWNTAFTEHDNWHVNAGDREFVAFSISPARGTLLRRAVTLGEVQVRVLSDGRRSPAELDLVTALIPGRRKEELWLYAHLYEPMANDNSSGVACALETARRILEEGETEFSLRLLFGMEHYGFAAYAVHRGDKNLSSEVIGACDYDAMCVRNDWSIDLRCAAAGTPFFGNYLLHRTAEELAGFADFPPVAVLDSSDCPYDDDMFLCDSTTGVATFWPIRRGEGLYHNSLQTMDFIDREALRKACALNTALVSALLSPGKEMAVRAAETARRLLKEEASPAVGSAQEHFLCRFGMLKKDFENFSRFLPEDFVRGLWEEISRSCGGAAASCADDIPRSPWRDYAEKIVPSRLTTGFPFDLARVPFRERVLLPGSVLYGPLAAVLSGMDGVRDLAALIRASEHEMRRLIPEREIAKLVRAVLYLARYGYVSLGGFAGIARGEIETALREANVREGDFLLVHSSLSCFGKFENGLETVEEAFREAVGPEGTVLFAAFTSPFIFLEEPNRLSWFRPMDMNDPDCIVTGALPKYLVQKGYPRSRHLTHSWCGFGRDAAEALAKHGPQDPPVGENSPLAFALRKKGKIVHFGSGLDSTTFLHFLEDRFGLPGVGDTLCRVRENGIVRTVAMPRNLPGHRDFYEGDEKSIKFFRAACASGLRIAKSALGPGRIMVMDMAELDAVGSRLVAADPFIMLCDTPSCLSCQRLRRGWNGSSPAEFQK